MTSRPREPDRVELGGKPCTPAGLPSGVTGNAPNTAPGSEGGRGPKKPFLSVWYRCCHVYGRLTRTQDGTRYRGACPRCGARVEALIGPGGTARRIFEAR